MKTNSLKTLSYIALAGALFSSFASAKGKPDLTDFKGSYSGVSILSGSGNNILGSTKIFIKVAKNGKSATLHYQGIFSSEGQTVLLPMTITLARNKTTSVSDLLFGTGTPKPGSGTWSQRKMSVTFNSINATDVFLNGTFAARDLRNKRKLTFSMTLNNEGTTSIFTISARAKLPRKSRR